MPGHTDTPPRLARFLLGRVAYRGEANEPRNAQERADIPDPLAGEPPPYANEELGALARHCTEQEDNASKVERRVRKSAAALLLSSRIGERFFGLVTGAGPKGTWVPVIRPPVEGKLVQGSQGLDVGDPVRVTLVRADVQQGFIDFARSNG